MHGYNFPKFWIYLKFVLFDLRGKNIMKRFSASVYVIYSYGHRHITPENKRRLCISHRCYEYSVKAQDERDLSFPAFPQYKTAETYKFFFKTYNI